MSISSARLNMGIPNTNIHTVMQRNATSEKAAQHVWGYFKKKATDKGRVQFQRILENYHNARGSHAKVKRQLSKLTNKYEEA